MMLISMTEDIVFDPFLYLNRALPGSCFLPLAILFTIKEIS